MKKAITIFIALCAVAISHSAQAQKPYEPMTLGAWTINAGIGVGFGTNNLPLRAAIEKGMWEVGMGVITLGGEANWNISANYSRIISFAARSAWHHGWNVAGLDTYGGLAIGPAFTADSAGYDGGFFIGGSYFIWPKFGFNLEMGLSLNPIGLGLSQIGVIWKL